MILVVIYLTRPTGPKFVMVLKPSYWFVEIQPGMLMPYLPRWKIFRSKTIFTFLCFTKKRLKMRKQEFEALTTAEQGMALISKGKHLTQLKKDDQLLNLYSFDDFFVEVYYSILSDKIDKIEIVSDLSRIDEYIEESKKS